MPLALLVFLLARGVVGTLPAAPASENEAARAEAGRAFELVRARLLESRQLLAAQSPLDRGEVRLAVSETEGGRIQLVTLTKDTFLSKGTETFAATSQGETVRVQIVRANGVNTAVRIFAETGREMIPLTVQYPIERDGVISDVAYYTSVHPALTSSATAQQGETYISRALARAAERLAENGERISPEIIRAAERLCVVEHTDHKRFMRENRSELFDEIATLYALNAGDTYRYSVSSAGAGGMIQMIAPTYATTRARHPSIALKADFVEGMRDHSNALQAMLLYMQDTWNDLLKEDEVRFALASGLATQDELLAAGYNSNPARLAGYLKRGGDGWRVLIPRETQMYLQIYAAVEAHAG